MPPSLRDSSSHPMHPPSNQALEARIEELTRALAQLEARIQRLEGFGEAPQAAGLIRPEASPSPVPAQAEHSHLASILGMVGRVCLILGGAFLLRALTDGGTVSHGIGLGLGFAYALTWALMAWRTPSALQAPYDALASILITYPLLWEATTTFALLRPPAVTALLLLAACLHVGVAWTRSLRAIAWLATFSVLGTAFGLMVATQSLEWFVALFLILGAGALWLTYGRGWQASRWPTALAANLAVLVLTVIATWPGGSPEGYRNVSPKGALALALGLVILYLGTFAARMLRRRRTLNAFEGVQTALVLLAGFGGAVHLALASGIGAPLGGGALAVGLACLAAAYPFAADEEGLHSNFSFFTTLALVFLLLGGHLVLPPGAFALAAGLLGVAATYLGLRLHRTVLLLHGAVALTAGAFASALLTQALAAFLGPPEGLGLPSSTALAILALIAANHGFLLANRPTGPVSWRFRLLSLLLGTQVILGLGVLGIWAAFRLICPGGSDAGLLAAFRTGALSAAAIGLGAFGRRFLASELRWLVLPMLALAGLQFFLEDLPTGRPLTLFLAFMAYGVALIIAPRFLKAPADPHAPPPSTGNM